MRHNVLITTTALVNPKSQARSSTFNNCHSTMSYSPIYQIDEEERLVSETHPGKGLDPHNYLRLSRYPSREVWSRYWAYFTYAALLSIVILFFTLWIYVPVCSQIPDEPVYCKHFIF